MIFRRKIYDTMLEWKKTNGFEALMIEGARRVGKTTIVGEFAKNEYRSAIIIDFSIPDDSVRSLFTDFGRDLDGFFMRLQILFDTVLYERESLIVFDEVQKFPLARQSIKHLVKDGRYDYIETGSLLSIKKNVQDILIPSEERSISMHPMDFEEFMWALGNHTLVPALKDAFYKSRPVGPEIHKLSMINYSTYMMVGGMPQAVDAYIKTNSMAEVDRVKSRILELYSKDSEKVNSKDILFKIPSFLSKHEKSFKPGTVRKGSKTREYLDSVHWLDESKMVNLCYRVTDADPALEFYLDELSFKMYYLDTGILVTAAMKSNIGDTDELYKKLAMNRLSMNNGMLFENMVSQELLASGHNLRFIRFKEDRESKTSHEVDFMISKGKHIVPIECKSSRSDLHASLDCFIKKYPHRVKNAYVIHTKDLSVDGKITYIPIYMTMFL